MVELLKSRFLEACRAVAPLIAVACVLQVVLVGASTALFVQFLAGSLLATIGMMLLFTGIEVGIVPMGRYIGADLPQRQSFWLIVGVAFALGFATTVAEPDVIVLAGQVEAAAAGSMSGRTLIYVTGAGVGLFAALALLRVVLGWRIVYLLAATYGVMLVLSFLAPPELVPLAYDAGSVTTGVLTAPVVLALALGLSTVLAGRSAINDGFGLLGFASAGPIVAILLLGLFT